MNKPISALMGLCVGDALGVPVEFNSRENLKANPVFEMRGYGTYNKPPGTWSDDTSMTLCLADSLSYGLDYNDIMVKFTEWYKKGKYTPNGEAFDIGLTTTKALSKFVNGENPLYCGCTFEKDNGNGSLMRIMPILFYLIKEYGEEFYNYKEAFEIIHNISKLTHGHKRCQIACGIYITIAGMIMKTGDLKLGIYEGLEIGKKFYENNEEFSNEINHFARLFNKNFHSIEERNIRSSGYVVDTLEAAVWCLLNTTNYRSCVLKAVNLGEDTDTVAAVAGGVAGLYYGIDNIPVSWISKVQKSEIIENISNGLNQMLPR